MIWGLCYYVWCRQSFCLMLNESDGLLILSTLDRQLCVCKEQWETMTLTTSQWDWFSVLDLVCIGLHATLRIKLFSMGRGFQGENSLELPKNLEELVEQPLTQKDGHRDGGHKMPIETAAQKGREGLDFVLAEIGIKREEKVPQDPTQILHTVHDVSFPAAGLVSEFETCSLANQSQKILDRILHTILKWSLTEFYRVPWNLARQFLRRILYSGIIKPFCSSCCVSAGWQSLEDLFTCYVWEVWGVWLFQMRAQQSTNKLEVPRQFWHDLDLACRDHCMCISTIISSHIALHFVSSLLLQAPQCNGSSHAMTEHDELYSLKESEQLKSEQLNSHLSHESSDNLDDGEKCEAQSGSRDEEVSHKVMRNNLF